MEKSYFTQGMIMKAYKKPQIVSANFMQEGKLVADGHVVPALLAAVAAGFATALAAGGRDVTSKKMGLPVSYFSLHKIAA